MKCFQSHRIHTQDYQYFSGKDDTSVSSSIVCGHGIFVLIENQKSSKVRGGLIMLVLSLCLKDSTDGEFLVSSGRLLQMRMVEGRNEL